MNTNTNITPVFIFSLPRSGSTLLQRMLATYDEISTTAETWMLLPFLYALKKEGVYAEYSHCSAYLALNEFCNELPNGKQDYLAAIRTAMVGLYTSASSPEAIYFLDKTPRYALVTKEILSTFPEGKAIFLWRNPLAIIASIIESFNNGKWNIFHSRIDLFDGIVNLVQAYNDSSGFLAVKYEDLVIEPEKTFEKIIKYLDLKFNNSFIDDFSSIKFEGCMGDPTGRREYNEISSNPLDKWKTILASPIRKMWCRRYLRWIGEDKLSIMGYDLSVLLSELNEIPSNWVKVVPDFWRSLYGSIYCMFEFKILKDKARKLLKRKLITKHE